MRHKYVWAVSYGLILVALAAYTLLDAFVIPKAYAQVDSNSQTGISTVIETTSTPAVSTRPHATSSDSNTASESVAESSEDSSSVQSTSPQTSATSYQDENISIQLDTLRVADTDVYVADIQVSSVEYLKTAFAQATYGRNVKQETSEIAESVQAILAINGDFYGWRDAGYVLRNGQLYRSTSNGSDVLVVSSTGEMYAASDSAVTAEELLAAGAWQVESFGPVLVEGGQVVVGETEEVAQSMRSNPRTAIGMVSPLHYVIVVSDGRTSQSAGLSLYELAQVFTEYKCSFAYNLDGGGSSTLWFQGQVINNPSSGRSSGERSVSDIVYIGY